MEKWLFAIVFWAHFFISPGWDASTFGMVDFQTLCHYLVFDSLWIVQIKVSTYCRERYCRDHQYVKNAGRKKIFFSLCCATNKLWEKWARNWFHSNCGWRRAFHPSLSCKSSLFFLKCYYPPKPVLAFLIAIAFAYNNAQHTVSFWHRLIWGSRVETYISVTM